MVPARNAEVLAERLDVLLSDAALRERMGINGREYAERHFSLAKVVEKHMEIYDSLTEEVAK